MQKLAAKLRERDPELADRARELVVSLSEAYFSARYPGFDLEEPDLHGKMESAGELLSEVRSRL